ncbi:cysteine hydrolase family protein [Pantoea sp. JK]|uniref:cysteine hydrolase family protein n=1 Tax=Pantoea sp. JK TaxID=2871703 RepID=UPI002237736F|nr:cysteine hydrolase family protein [Pantoea sp. JK]MCW6030008.1 cysteine hydrolase [Pantoea sp. JK]
MQPQPKALLVIDMQNGLFHATPAPYAAESVLANINQLIALAHQAHAPVFFARHTGPDGSPFAESGPLTQLIPELQMDASHDRVFVKRYPNCFRDTELLSALKSADIQELVIVGMKSEYCVDTTCRAAADLGFRVVLIEDGHTSVDNGVLSAEQIIAHHNQTLAGPFVQRVSSAAYAF